MISIFFSSLKARCLSCSLHSQPFSTDSLGSARQPLSILQRYTCFATDSVGPIVIHRSFYIVKTQVQPWSISSAQNYSSISDRNGYPRLRTLPARQISDRSEEKKRWLSARSLFSLLPPPPAQNPDRKRKGTYLNSHPLTFDVPWRRQATCPLHSVSSPCGPHVPLRNVTHNIGGPVQLDCSRHTM